jgi:K+-sensing histidine kinase KdpD
MSDGVLAIGVPDDMEVARELLARGRWLARAFGLAWIAVMVEKKPARRRRSGAADSARQMVSDLVSALGGEIRCAEGDDVSTALLRVAHEENAAILLIGHSQRPRVLRRLVRGTTEQLLGARRSFDVIVSGRSA